VQRYRANPQVADTKDYWFLDHLLNELRDRFVKLKQEDELHIYDAYRPDLQTPQEFTLEVKSWKARWELYPTDQIGPSHLCETLELANKKLYPHLYCILKNYIAIPPSTTTAERSFSVLKRVKTYLRATMSQERLSALALLHIHRDIQLQLDAVVDTFNNTRQRKLLFIIMY